MRMFLNGEVRLRQRETPTDDVDSLDAATAEDDPLAYTVRQHLVMEALQALPYNQRQVMGLLIAEFSPAEIADLLGSTDKAVRQTLYRARITLNEHVKPAWKETS
jgi:RNA polymerase sigma-70 factor (ECF subfamily)